MPTTARQESAAETSGSMDFETIPSKMGNSNGNTARRLRRESTAEAATNERVAILDFGAQYGKVTANILIAFRGVTVFDEVLLYFIHYLFVS